mmetsp:Transcript_31080/g.58292  ORF Transcript_31080/g.58292 Transcript_31080/m.58292 type:complete len:248 (+) Transcript_31080:54-797(+)
MVRKVILLRHGETEWSAEKNFAGWTDVDLTEAGKKAATDAGKCLKEKGVKPDVVFTSKLRRSVCTAWLALMESDNVTMPIINSWRLNERHYGILVGMGRTNSAWQHTFEKVDSWLKMYEEMPPAVDAEDERHPCNDSLYENLPRDALPGSESVRMTVDRVLPFWYDQIAPCVQAGKTPLVSAHGNSLRALCKELEGLSEEKTMELVVAPGVPLVVELSDSMEFIQKYYLMDEAVVKKCIEQAENNED